MIVLRSYISVSYTVLVNGPIRPFTDTEIYDRNTITGITAKHGRKRPYFPRIPLYTTFYGVRNIRSGYYIKPIHYSCGVYFYEIRLY